MQTVCVLDDTVKENNKTNQTLPIRKRNLFDLRIVININRCWCLNRKPQVDIIITIIAL